MSYEVPQSFVDTVVYKFRKLVFHKVHAVSAKFIGPSDRQDKYVIGPIYLISGPTEMSDVASVKDYPTH